MEMYKTIITDDLWDFIEANVPNYHEREEVLRQAQLQLLIDGHESPVAGITREEAIMQRDNILHGLFAEAVAAFTAKQPVEVPGGTSLHDYAETLADIAYECGTRRFRYGSDSRMKITRIIAWAECSMRISDESKLPEYLKKGVRVYVSGYPHVKAWAGKDGKPAGTLGIYIDKLELLSPKE